MRAALVFAFCLTSPALAETFVLRGSPQEVTIYPGVARITRHISLDLPAGTHQIILPDLPPGAAHQTPRIAVSGAVLGAVSLRDSALDPLADTDSPAIEAARAALKEAQAALDAHADAETAVTNRSDAAAAQIAFLERLGGGDALLADATALDDLVSVVGTRVLQARRDMLAARQELRGMAEAREDLEEALTDAQQALAALLTAGEDRVQVAAALSTDTATTAQIELSYFVEADWRPTYEFSLAQTEPVQLSIKRGAEVTQYSGEDWRDVMLTLSTLRISDTIAPHDLSSQWLRIEKPAPPQPAPKLLSRTESLAEPLAEAPMIVDETAVAYASFNDVEASYAFPNPVTVANNVDQVRLALDTLGFEAEIFARAVPLHDETAFLMATFTNTSPEPIFESYENRFSLDNTLIGRGNTDQIPAGAEATLAFGPVEDLRLDRVRLDKNEGDSGIINRSNTSSEEVRITIENLGARNWPVRLLDRVPVSTQEDLVITHSATPRPDIEDPEDKQGLLEWRFDLAPGAEKSILLKHDMQWPLDMILR
ncbi:mucoidy inhibitor MuiA family protein [Ruegeria sp. WL0004]|uniref:Mucoidy inhibitor MuiA family protein n=1 Tax=Ruegeria marisflavi TaxID=2984152 RepID=A0ABT2WSL1_9RHOB|nr:mucoidy inhibitor MuiA family protein [Ruegeria sp. WL0004]MCU9838878.1 mucoidy inhibitor MuiA family protein [Ruegeria sp. WL0004]